MVTNSDEKSKAKQELLFRKLCGACGAVANGDEHKALCPAHDDKNPSLGLKLQDSGVIDIHCWAGCKAADLAKALGVVTWRRGKDGRLLIPPGEHHDKQQEQDRPGLTVGALAEYTGVPAVVLESFGLREYKGAVVIPYRNWDGTRGRTRLRIALTGDKHRWSKKGKGVDPVIPYQLRKLRLYKERQARERLTLPPLWVVEGESDCWALWSNLYPAVGIPGANMATAIKHIQAKHLEGFPAVVVWQEPDAAGGKFVSRVLDHIEGLGFDRKKVKVVAQEKYKDPCEVFKGPWNLATVNDLMDNAVTVEQFRAMPEHFTQLDVSRSFAREFTRRRFLHNADLGGWFAWDGSCYAPRSEDKVYLRMVDYLEHLREQGKVLKNEEMKKSYRKLVTGLSTTASIHGTIRGAEAFLHVGESDLDANALAFNLRNGWYDLHGHEFHEHARPMHFSRVGGTHYDKDASCPLWEQCVDAYWDDKEVVRYFRQQCGLLLSGETFKHMVYFYGVGDNGKSMLVELMRAMLGTYAAVLDINDILAHKNPSGQSYGIFRLRGARLVGTTELPDGARLNEGLIKAITGGSAITARDIYSKPIDFRPQFKLWFDGNYKPQLSTDDAVWERFHYLPFAKQFPQDNTLLPRLKTELPGIFNWCVAGWKDYQENGLFVPATLLEEKRKFKAESNDFAVFADTCLVRSENPDAKLPKKEVYTAFYRWWEWNKPRKGYIPDSNKFSREFGKLGYKAKSSHGEWYWLGVEANADFRSCLNNDWTDIPVQ